MKIDVSESMFRDEFRKYNRTDNFSYEGLGALYDYLIELKNDCGEEWVLDVIGLCCEFVELDEETIAQDYSNIIDDYNDVEDMLENETMYIKLDSGDYIYQAF